MIRKRKHRKATIEEKNEWAKNMTFFSRGTMQIHLTKRAQEVKVTLPRLKFMEKEDV